MIHKKAYICRFIIFFLIVIFSQQKYAQSIVYHLSIVSINHNNSQNILSALIEFHLFSIMFYFLMFFYNYNQIMISLKGKKHKILFGKSTNNLLRINNHLPVLPNLNILKIENPAPPLQKTAHRKIKSHHQSLSSKKITQNSLRLNERNQNPNFQKHFSLNTNKINSYSKKVPILQNQVAQGKNNQTIKQREQNETSTLNVLADKCLSSLSVIQKLQKDDFTQNQRKKTDTTYSEPLKMVTQCFTICSVYSYIIGNGQSSTKSELNQIDLLNNQLILQKQQQKDLQDEAKHQKILELDQIIKKKQIFIQEKQAQIKQNQSQIAIMQLTIINLSLAAEKYIEQEKKCHQMRMKMQKFIENQPNKILKLSVQGYRQSIQELFNLASALQFSTYQNMLNHLYEEMEIPQKSLFYVIEDFQINSHPQDEFKKFKQKLNDVYEKIMSKIRQILSLKSQKIQMFVHTLRQLASYTIDKRQYLDDINTKMIDLSVLSEVYMSEVESLFQECPSKFQKIKEVIKSMKTCYNQAQIFY